MDRTFLMVKPDGVQRGLIGRIVSRLEDKGFKMAAGKLVQVSREQAERHYAEHVGKPFFEELVGFITSGPVFAMVWEGDNIVTLSRLLIGKTQVTEALPGTIRGDFAAHTPFNLIHGSDSPESAEREIANFFTPEELVRYEKTVATWV
ncbi:nucleoside-diphosphate kinase [Paenibacillus polymyxa]|jgi:nucleoside-diphosphate kinase|uniref:Nucleoside diphosphate kinase n=3 Tax=Paenibacillus TaxID=44249 RepID=E3E4U9_PAEPS|nr:MULTISPECIES: nucleoside-diphosphate kinase [Paenibacillus]ADO57077.1 nucleoside diphosphate kinase [Paenibacillus polymyxa SC2]AHM66546.1 nucleoside diphosphate kinase (ndk) (ndp kinase)(nucleoside-2-p kinase) [Paenibacillus polymyxa SQR-21]AIY07468.1 nucleoside diphosphate kinase [Paenibacillus polymyxa]AJE53561.1 nucleoside diphosphate kinase [Paenibacillus polymyxa]AUO08394.1 nucleoside-diphosphate kinase [Paenibacillus sp. lzh-N1]